MARKLKRRDAESSELETRGREPKSRAARLVSPHESFDLRASISQVPVSHSRLLIKLLVASSLLLASVSARAGGELPVLTQAAQVHKLTSEQAKRGYPIHLRAIVTYFHREDLFVQDATGGIWVDLRTTQASFHPGQRLDLYGVSGDGFAPYVAKPRWRVLGEGPMPPARRISYAEMSSSRDDSLWVEAEGVVRSVGFDRYDQLPVMMVVTVGGEFEVYLGDLPGQPPAAFVDAKVLIQGVCGAAFNSKNQLISVRLYSPGLRFVKVVEPAPADPFSVPTLPIARLGRFSAEGTASHRVKVQGTLSMQVPQRMLFITDRSGAVLVEASDPTPLNPGDQVEVVGFPSTGGYSPVLKDSLFRKIRSGRAPAPARVSADQVLTGDFDDELIEVEGRVQADTWDARGHTLVLQAGQVIYDAAVDEAAIGPQRWPALAIGTRLRLVGICSISTDGEGHPTGFRLTLQSPAAITVLTRPSWWSARRVSGLAAVLAGILLVSVLCVTMLRRRVDEQTAMLRASLESTVDGIQVVNSSGAVVAYNSKFREVWGLPDALLQSESRSARLSFVASQVKDPEPFKARVNEIYADHETQSDDVIELKDGRVFERHSEPQRVKGKNTGRVWGYRDITERARTEAALREVSDRLNLALKSAKAGTWSFNLIDGTLLWDSHAAAIYGLEPGDPKHDCYPHLRNCVHPDDLKHAEQLIARSASEGVPFDCEHRVTWPDGSSHVIANRGEVYREEGKPLRIIGVAWDVTDRRRVEEALSEERYLLRTLMDSLPDKIYFKDRESRFTRVNLAHARQLGLTDPAQAIGKTDFDFFSEEHAGQAFADEREIIKTGQPVLAKEEKETWPDGSETWCLTTKMPQRDAAGNIIGTFGLSMDITDRKRAEKDAEERTAYLNALLENNPLAITVVDPENRIQVCNRAFEQLFRCRRPDVVGSNINELLAPPHLQKEAKEYTVHVADGEYVHGTAVRRRSDGSLVDVEIYGVPLILEGRFVGSFGIYQDITERKRAQEELERAKEAAEAGSRAKSEFLANMSHEIRTPMNGVLGMIELALDTDLTPDQRDYLGMVKSSADALLTILNDILDFSKIEAGKLDLDPIAFRLRDHLAQTMKPLALRAHQKGLELTYDIHCEVPDEVVTDPSRLRQIIINLAGNAIKFTERGEVGIEVGVESKARDRAQIHFQVRDTGIGIDPEKQAVIFTAFSQADGSTARRYGGTGLGLTISSRLVELMGGRMWLESELGKGSCFHFTVPVGVAATTAAPVPIEQWHLAGVRVLVVDDNSTNRRILAEILERWGMKAALAESGAQALTLLEESRRSATPFDLLLADVNMPEMDGFTLVERIRQHEDLHRTTIMMLTSVGQRGDAARCRQLGIAAYLIKPVGQSQLLEAVLNVLGTGRQAAHEAPLVTRHSLRERKTGLRVLLAEDNPVNQKLAERLLEKRGYKVVVASNGRQALRALEKERFDLVLMDVSMPEMDGLEATRAIRAAELKTGSHLPIVAMTAHAMKGDRERCLDAGMDGYVSKPIQAKELFEVAEQALHAVTMA